MEKQVIPIAQAKQGYAEKPYVLVQGFIESVGDIKTGTRKDGEEYKRQELTLTDESTSIILTLWGEDCSTLKPQHYYRVDGVIKNHEGILSIQKSKFGKISEVQGIDLTPNNDTSDGFFESDSPPDPPRGVDVQEDNKNAQQFAKEILHDFIDAMKEKGCVTPDGCSAVWNTAMMQWWKKHG